MKKDGNGEAEWETGNFHGWRASRTKSRAGLWEKALLKQATDSLLKGTTSPRQDGVRPPYRQV